MSRVTFTQLIESWMFQAWLRDCGIPFESIFYSLLCGVVTVICGHLISLVFFREGLFLWWPFADLARWYVQVGPVDGTGWGEIAGLYVTKVVPLWVNILRRGFIFASSFGALLGVALGVARIIFQLYRPEPAGSLVWWLFAAVPLLIFVLSLLMTLFVEGFMCKPENKSKQI